VKIPTSFKLTAHHVKVRTIPKEKWKHPDCVGFYEPHDNTIHVMESDGNKTQHAFAHELVHAILHHKGHKLYSHEGFVDSFAALLTQALTTARYPEPRQPRRKPTKPRA
jgi:hypothetical protein